MTVTVSGAVVNNGVTFGDALTIVTNGLILNLDAGNTSSYSGSGSTWTDLSSTASSVTMNGSPTYTTLGTGKCFQFTGTGQNFTGTLNGTQPTTDLTIESWIYPQTDVSAGDMATILLVSGGQSAYMSLDKSSRKLASYWYGHPSEGYWETGAAISNNTWTCFTAVWNYSTSTIYQYVNNVQTSGSPTVGNAATGSSLNIGQEGASRQFAGGISIVRMYNRALNSAEVYQNFTALRGRFSV